METSWGGKWTQRERDAGILAGGALCRSCLEGCRICDERRACQECGEGHTASPDGRECRRAGFSAGAIAVAAVAVVGLCVHFLVCRRRKAGSVA